MKVLNLDPHFIVDDEACVIEHKLFTFPGGEPHIKLANPEELNGEKVIISHRITSFNKIGEVLVAADALRNADVSEISLFIPYLPGARQDRVAVPGEALTVKVYTDIINSQNFKIVAILDAHSDVAPALLDNCTSVNNYDFVEKALEQLGTVTDPILISPDAGANKKIKDLCVYLNKKGLIRTIVKCDKSRDVKTGSIDGFEVYADNLEGRTCIIVDDICDGGGTFVGLAEELKKKGAGDIHLIVTHGIFSKGWEPFTKLFKSITCTDSFKNIEFNDPDNRWPGFSVNQIKLKDI